MEIIGVIVAGIIIGLLGKFVAPGSRDNIPLWLTILCGIGGVIIGWYVYAGSAATAAQASIGSGGSLRSQCCGIGGDRSYGDSEDQSSPLARIAPLLLRPPSRSRFTY